MKILVLLFTVFFSSISFAVPCAPGTYSSDGDNAGGCTPCEEGKFSDVAGSTSCTSCELGTVQPLPGQASCNACDPGTYMDIQGQLVCIDCPAGYFQQESEARYCVECPAGTSSNVAATSCYMLGGSGGGGCGTIMGPPSKPNRSYDILSLFAAFVVVSSLLHYGFRLLKRSDLAG